MKINEVEVDLQTVLEINCSKALSSSIPLYRGMSNTKPNTLIMKSIRQDRTPLNSNLVYVMIFDKFMEVCGFPHRKANTTSFSTNRQVASNYGQVHDVWAFDDAQYVYSLEFDDFISVSQMIRRNFDGSTTDRMHPNKFDSLKEYIERWGPDFKQQWGFNITSNPNDLAPAPGEVLVYGSKYIAKYDNTNLMKGLLKNAN